MYCDHCQFNGHTRLETCCLNYMDERTEEATTEGKKIISSICEQRSTSRNSNRFDGKG